MDRQPQKKQMSWTGSVVWQGVVGWQNEDIAMVQCLKLDGKNPSDMSKY